MSKKNHSRKSAYRRTGEQPVQVQAPRLGDQSTDTYRPTPSVAPDVYPSRSVQLKPKFPTGIVLVRYAKGKDKLQLEDQITHELLTLTPGDSRHVHMNTALVATLKRQGFELEVM